MLAEQPQHAFIGIFKDVVRHAVIEERIESLSDASIPVGKLVEAPPAIGCIGSAAMPELAVLEVKVARLDTLAFEQTDERPVAVCVVHRLRGRVTTHPLDSGKQFSYFIRRQHAGKMHPTFAIEFLQDGGNSRI